jgi:gamma-glutamylputrescine oxidase
MRSDMRDSGASRQPHSTVWLPLALDEPAPVPTGHLHCDVAVVGGGLSGLSTALHLKLAAPQLDVVLLEAGRIGYGASGLNSGQCAPRIGPAIEDQVRSQGEAFARAAYDYSLGAIEFAVGLVKRLRIDCEIRCAGQWQVALRDADSLKLERRAALYRSLGVDVPLLGAEAVRASLPDAYRIRNALVFPAWLLNPGQLCIGMKRAAQDHGVRIFEDARVERLERSTDTLHVGASSIRATRVVFAVDGAIGGLIPLRGTVLPVTALAAVTRPLSAAQRAGIGWAQGQGLYDARPMFNFLRPLEDGRLLIGGGYRYARGLKAGIAQKPQDARDLLAQLSLFFPSLHSMTADVVWHGLLGCTLNEWPIVAPLDHDRRRWHIGAWNGHGVALALRAGHDLANAMTGQIALPEIPWHSPRAMNLPHSLISMLVPLYLEWLRRSSRMTI